MHATACTAVLACHVLHPQTKGDLHPWFSSNNDRQNLRSTSGVTFDNALVFKEFQPQAASPLCAEIPTAGLMLQEAGLELLEPETAALRKGRSKRSSLPEHAGPSVPACEAAQQQGSTGKRRTSAAAGEGTEVQNRARHGKARNSLPASAGAGHQDQEHAGPASPIPAEQPAEGGQQTNARS